MPVRMNNMRHLFISHETENENPATTTQSNKAKIPCSVSTLLSSGRSIRTESTETIMSDVSDDWSGCSSVTEMKSVSFAPRASLHHVLSRSDYTEKEKRAAWYQSEDYDRITRDCVKQVRKMENGEELKDKKYCSRGLEAHTHLAAIAKRENRQAAYVAVLDEQDDQWEQEGGNMTTDGERISRAYINVSSSCHMWASVVGLRDQKAAEDYLS
mmetsp:Transcript_132105/g.196806  ORF Transcript_132105/g.196806 Transcript_132105/m.196806 type:complete len:213 (-) Transcript_132105:127-765(-)